MIRSRGTDVTAQCPRCARVLHLTRGPGRPHHSGVVLTNTDALVRAIAIHMTVGCLAR